MQERQLLAKLIDRAHQARAAIITCPNSLKNNNKTNKNRKKLQYIRTLRLYSMKVRKGGLLGSDALPHLRIQENLAQS